MMTLAAHKPMRTSRSDGSFAPDAGCALGAPIENISEPPTG